ncbi:MAG: hypothetical protein Q7V88_14945 [Actinomycetota bacterium]|nr:hypothetical protein [Actinomycetota bacterium]
MHLSPDDDDFWYRYPEGADYLKPIVEAGRENGVPTTLFVMGDPFDENTPAFVVFKMPPGAQLPRHGHDCQRFEVLLRGTLTSGGHPVKPGDVMLAAPHEMYGPQVAGDDGYIVCEYFSRLKGAYEIIWETKRGPWTENVLADGWADKIERAEASPQ